VCIRDRQKEIPHFVLKGSALQFKRWHEIRLFATEIDIQPPTRILKNRRVAKLNLMTIGFDELHSSQQPALGTEKQVIEPGRRFI
jgi:hypothetical protein